jgi:hypothetical protein
LHRSSTPLYKVALISAIGAIGTFSSIGFAAPVITSVSGSVTQGGTLTISGSGFGTKSPAQPYLWAPMNGDLNPSSLGVMKSWASITSLNYQAGCGPAANTGCAAGTPSDGVTTNRWAAAVYSPSHFGSGNDWNSYGQKSYVYRKSKRTFAYSNNGSTNVKTFRVWGTSATAFLAYPDFYWSVYNGRIGIEGIPQNSTNDYTMSSTTVSTAMGPVNKWYSEEYALSSNTSATSSDGDFRVDINGGADLVSFPNNQWERNSITLKTASGYQGDGTMKVLYPVHMLIESGGNWIPAPSGSQYFTADVYADTTWARVMVGNSPTFNQTTDREIQVPVQWSSGSIQVNVNVNAFPTGQQMYLFVVDSNGNASPGFPIKAGTSTSGTPTPTTPVPDPPGNVTVQ